MHIINNVIRVNKKYYPQTLLEECKHVIRKNKMENRINHDLSLSSSDESDNEVFKALKDIRLLLLLKHHFILLKLIKERKNTKRKNEA